MIPLEVTIGAYGDIVTDKHVYRPLDKVKVKINGRRHSDKRCKIRVCDTSLQPYYENDVILSNNSGTCSFIASGKLGVHWIYLYFPDSEKHKRYLNFIVDCETSIETGNSLYDRLYPVTKEAMLLGRREFEISNSRFVGYISGDSWRINGVWLRDWIYQLPAYKYWEKELTCGLERFLEKQNSNGMIPDGITRDGKIWRSAVESDVEYILILGILETYRTIGDESWLRKVLPYIKKALKYIENDKSRWDKKYQLVKRGHTCDTWDFVMGKSKGRSVIATCDQSGYYFAYKSMADIYLHLGNKSKAENFEHRAERYQRQSNNLLWDGKKYLHHVHLKSIEHPGFDESQQLAMGNVWAITRGLANHEQSVSIIKEYRRRHKETKDAFPWWSLQPGYPDRLGYYKYPYLYPYLHQGGYANGGLMPWVGGELCLAAFEHGMESYGFELYRQYIKHLKSTGNRVHVWYWPDGQAGFRTTNEVPYTGWGMAQWLNSLIEGLAGVKDESVQMKTMKISPRWAVTNQTDVLVIVRYAINDSYFAYHMKIYVSKKIILLRYCGSGKYVNFHILLPKKLKIKSILVNNKLIKFSKEKLEESIYVNFDSIIDKESTVKIFCN